MKLNWVQRKNMVTLKFENAENLISGHKLMIRLTERIYEYASNSI